MGLVLVVYKQHCGEEMNLNYHHVGITTGHVKVTSESRTSHVPVTCPCDWLSDSVGPICISIEFPGNTEIIGVQNSGITGHWRAQKRRAIWGSKNTP